MKRIIAAAMVAICTQASADALDSAAKGITDNVVTPMANELSKRVMRSLAEGQGPMAEAAKRNLKQQEVASKERNRGVRRSVKECIKPGNVIDDDVQECVRGYREKTW